MSSICMVPRTQTYSLSGVVTISVASPYSIFEGRRNTARLLLKSLSLTFEGQSEIYTPSTGYSSLRLCSVTRELAPAEPTELSNDGHEDDATPCKWDIVFNIPIPGWLPASTSLGIEDIGIRYGLHATAQFANLETGQITPWSFATLCTPFRCRTRYAVAHKGIKIHRFVLPPHVEQSEQTFHSYLVSSHTSSSDSSNARIPAEILDKIQVLASVAESVDIKSSSLPITIRLRTKDLEDAECKRLQISEVGVDIIQKERCRFRPSATYLAQYPIPAQEMQPPNTPLRDPHPMSNIYDVGLYITRDHSESVCRSFTLLPPGETGKYRLSEDNYAFASDWEQSESPTWYTMETQVPFTRISRATLDQETEEWAGPACIRPSSSSPLFSVSHEVAISLTFLYDVPGTTERAKERLHFQIPASFGRYLPSPSTLASLVSPDSENELSPSLSLPSYAQLYDENGERKIDYSIPLPLYTPKCELDPETIATSVEKPAPRYTLPEEEPLMTSF
ncbi:hypothetical protein FA15DRAFT_197829 [Coprinopsis marcescibilis]|uniref:Arrestin-like N-terminal domain-containing protein n=1 Tax=Coprinopsis marcescibilis TaxID=230819 RepID=A0A5C3LBX3_COPMA|nr:hypothetical protein FA15DRAFT_197829 [Coprinopsis marcescibilis]